MSLIQKLENSYVAILRVFVIVIATILLIAAAVVGISSLKGMLPGAQEKADIAAVDPKDVLAEVAPDEKRNAAGEEPQTTKSNQAKVNPYAADYDKAYAAVNAFVTKTSKNTLTVDKTSFSSALDNNLSNYDADNIKAKYISGLAATFAASLSDKRLIARIEKSESPKRRQAAAPVPPPVQEEADGEQMAADQPVPAPTPEPVFDEKPYKESPYNVVNEVLNAYNKMFTQKLADAKEKQEAAVAEQMQAKASSAMRLYVAAGLFASFLLVIFLTIAIRIERNMREIAARP
jgi:FlaG/FlaF family flagellin (archaellin)